MTEIDVLRAQACVFLRRDFAHANDRRMVRRQRFPAGHAEHVVRYRMKRCVVAVQSRHQHLDGGDQAVIARTLPRFEQIEAGQARAGLDILRARIQRP